MTFEIDFWTIVIMTMIDIKCICQYDYYMQLLFTFIHSYHFIYDIMN